VSDTIVGLYSDLPRANRSRKSCISPTDCTVSYFGLSILTHIFMSSLSLNVKCSKKHFILQKVSKSIFAFSLDQSRPNPAIILRAMSSNLSCIMYEN